MPLPRRSCRGFFQSGGGLFPSGGELAQHVVQDTGVAVSASNS